MNFKKFISGVSALTIAASAFAGMAVTASATDINATLVHTASTTCGADKNVVTGSVDAEKQHYNQEGSNTWQGYAFAEFSFSIPEGETITSATLSWKASTTATSRKTSVYYLKTGNTLNYEQIASSPTLLRYNSNKTWIADYNFSNTASYDTDVLSAIEATKGQGYIIFQYTNNAGGADLEGKLSNDAPTLAIVTTKAVLYTATFTETNGVTPTVKIYSDSSRSTEVNNGLLSDGVEYYYTATASGYNDYNGSFTVNSADPQVSFTMTAKTAAEYTANYIINGTSDAIADPVVFNGYVGDPIKATAPKYIVSNNTLYKRIADSYTSTVQSAEATQSVDFKYSVDADHTDGLKYKFIEASGAGTSSSASGGTYISGGIGANQPRQLSFTVDESGVYTWESSAFTSNATSSLAIVNTANTNKVLGSMDAANVIAKSADFAQGSYKEVKVEDITLKAGTTYYIVGNSGSTGVDYALLTKTDNLTYNVSTSADHGQINVVSTAKEYSNVQFTVTPVSGYEISEVSIKDAANQDVEYSEANGTYTFTMPGSNVTITATFTEIPVVGPTAEVTGISYKQYEKTSASDKDVTAAKVYVHITGTAQSLGLEYDGTTKPVAHFEGLTDANILLGAIIPGLVDLELSSFTAVAN